MRVGNMVGSLVKSSGVGINVIVGVSVGRGVGAVGKKVGNEVGSLVGNEVVGAAVVGAAVFTRQLLIVVILTHVNVSSSMNASIGCRPGQPTCITSRAMYKSLTVEEEKCVFPAPAAWVSSVDTRKEESKMQAFSI